MKPRLCAYRSGGRVTVETLPGTSAPRPARDGVQQWTLTDAEARALAAQLVAATVNTERIQEGAELVRKGTDFFAQLRRIAGR